MYVCLYVHMNKCKVVFSSAAAVAATASTAGRQASKQAGRQQFSAVQFSSAASFASDKSLLQPPFGSDR